MEAGAEISSLGNTVFTSAVLPQLQPLPTHNVGSVFHLGGVTASGPMMNGLPQAQSLLYRVRVKGIGSRLVL